MEGEKMSDWSLAMWIALFVWQATIAFCLAILFRQVTVLSHKVGLLDLEGPSEFEFVAGLPLPTAVITAASIDPDYVTYVLWLSSECATCGHLASELRTVEGGSPEERFVFLVTGAGRTSDEMTDQVKHLGSVVRDPSAKRLVSLLTLDRSPFVIESESHVVTGWNRVESLKDLDVLRNARISSNASSIAARARSVALGEG